MKDFNAVSALSRLSPGQRIELTAETCNGRTLTFATLYDKDERTSENEDGYISETTLNDEDDFASILDRLEVAPA